jgi:hypothetical protein
MQLELGEDDANEEEEDGNDDDTGSATSASVSLSASLNSSERQRAVNAATLIKTESKGGFHGLGLLSTVGAAEVQKQEGRSSAAVTAQLLLGGPLSIFGDELLKGDVMGGSDSGSVLGSKAGSHKSASGAKGGGSLVNASKSTMAGTRSSTGSSSKSKFTLKRKPFIDHRAVDNMKMKEISTTYS